MLDYAIFNSCSFVLNTHRSEVWRQLIALVTRYDVISSIWSSHFCLSPSCTSAGYKIACTSEGKICLFFNTMTQTNIKPMCGFLNRFRSIYDQGIFARSLWSLANSAVNLCWLIPQRITHSIVQYHKIYINITIRFVIYRSNSAYNNFKNN